MFKIYQCKTKINYILKKKKKYLFTFTFYAKCNRTDKRMNMYPNKALRLQTNIAERLSMDFICILKCKVHYPSSKLSNEISLSRECMLIFSVDNEIRDLFSFNSRRTDCILEQKTILYAASFIQDLKFRCLGFGYFSFLGIDFPLLS